MVCSTRQHKCSFHVKYTVIKRHNSAKAFRKTTVQYVLIWHFIMASPPFSMIRTFCRSWDEIGCPPPFQFFPVPEVRGLNFSSNPSKHGFESLQIITNHSFEDCSLEHNLPGMSLHLQFSMGLTCYKFTSLFIRGTLLSWKHTGVLIKPTCSHSNNTHRNQQFLHM